MCSVYNNVNVILKLKEYFYLDKRNNGLPEKRVTKFCLSQEKHNVHSKGGVHGYVHCLAIPWTYVSIQFLL